MPFINDNPHNPEYYQRLQKIEQYNALRNKCLENLEHLGKIE